MEVINPRKTVAKECAIQGHKALVGERFRFEPAPNKLTEKLEESFLKGGLDASKCLLERLEKDPSMGRDDVMAWLHMHIMEHSNDIYERFGEGEKIKGVEYWTDRYLSENSQEVLWNQQLEHPQLLQ